MRSLSSIGLPKPPSARPSDCRRAGDHEDDFLGSRPCGLTVADGSASPQHPNAARYAEDLIEVVADDQYGEALPLELEDHLFDRFGFRDPKRCGWFVHENELRAPSSGSGDRHHLPLTAREQFHRLVD